jgi:hypothetical protein
MIFVQTSRMVGLMERSLSPHAALFSGRCKLVHGRVELVPFGLSSVSRGAYFGVAIFPHASRAVMRLSCDTRFGEIGGDAGVTQAQGSDSMGVQQQKSYAPSCFWDTLILKISIWVLHKRVSRKGEHIGS